MSVCCLQVYIFGPYLSHITRETCRIHIGSQFFPLPYTFYVLTEGVHVVFPKMWSHLLINPVHNLLHSKWSCLSIKIRWRSKPLLVSVFENCEQKRDSFQCHFGFVDFSWFLDQNKRFIYYSREGIWIWKKECQIVFVTLPRVSNTKVSAGREKFERKGLKQRMARKNWGSERERLVVRREKYVRNFCFQN